MAVGADFDLQVMAQRGAGNKGVTATADHVDRFVFGMYAVFHGALLGGGPGQKKGRSVAAGRRPRKKKTFGIVGSNGFVGT